MLVINNYLLGVFDIVFSVGKNLGGNCFVDWYFIAQWVKFTYPFKYYIDRKIITNLH